MAYKLKYCPHCDEMYTTGYTEHIKKYHNEIEWKSLRADNTGWGVQ